MYFQRNDDVDSTYTLHGSNVERTSVKRPKKKQNGELQNKTCAHELVMDNTIGTSERYIIWVKEYCFTLLTPKPSLC